ncbi:MAG TPA: hypothetical protein VLM38_13565 [Blastocatellia bacterium]|nr:hypothetical protein [Blastocatellia bacterium]
MPPGKEGKIELAVEHTEGYSGETAKSAHVTTNDPKQPSFNLVLRARFKVEAPIGAKPEPPLNPNVVFNVEPGDHWITSALVGSSAANYFYLYNPQPTPFHIKNVIPDGSNFIVTLQTVQDGKRYELKVASNPALKPGHYVQTLKLATDSPVQPEVSINLDLTVIPKVFASPQAITMPMLPAASDLSKISWPSIYVRKLREGGLQIKSYTSTVPFVKLQLLTETEGQVYKINLALDSSKIKPGEFKGKIRIETNDLDVPVIEIPVQASFK